MKRITILCILGLGILAATGCSRNVGMLKSPDAPVRNDVFAVQSESSPIPAVHADLTIVSSLKTHLAGAHAFGDQKHGTPDYQVTVIIDGQEVTLRGEVREESREPLGIRDPEAGRGARYQFRKELRLTAGTHRVVAAIPEDGVRVERDISLSEGSSNTLTLEPVYRVTALKGKPAAYGQTGFKEGMRGFRVLLDGKEL